MKKAKYGEFLKLNMGKNTILSFFPHIKEAWAYGIGIQAALTSLGEVEKEIDVVGNVSFTVSVKEVAVTPSVAG